MPPDPQNRDRPQSVSTWLVIPYFDSDLGRKGVERPIPPGKGASWLCPSIFVDDVPGNTAFRRGVPIRVALAVANWGSGPLPAAALVRLWWSDPTLAFATATAIGQTTIVVPPGGVPVQTGTFTVTIPHGASPHVCLLAQVSAPIDGSSGIPDPHGDRHWAQLNLVEVKAVAAGGAIVLPVLLGNPFAEPRRTVLGVAPMSREEASLLGRLRERDIRFDVDAELEVRNGATDARRIELLPFETRRVDLALLPSLPSESGAAQGFVLTQHLEAEDPDDGEEPALLGTLGVLIEPD